MIPMPTIFPYPFNSLIRWQLLSNSIQNEMNTAAISNKLFKWKPFGSNLDGSSRHLFRFYILRRSPRWSYIHNVGLKPEVQRHVPSPSESMFHSLSLSFISSTAMNLLGN